MCGATLIKLPGQSIDVEHLLQRFSTVLRGIIQGVFRQQAGGAWFPCRDLKLAITVLMPQSSEPHHWFGAVACREGSWPMELPNPRPLLRPVTLRTFARLRHLSMSPHLWGTLNPDWRSGYRWLHLETPIVESAWWWKGIAIGEHFLEVTSLFSYLSSLQMQALRYCDRA